MPVITRFAPSPTGMLHIGGARTALYNKLLARHHGGTFLVRIEDTDRKRSTSEAIEAIHKGLEWLGLEGDEAPVHQSTRADRHRECAERLVAEGKAYYCYASREEIDAARQKAEAEGGSRKFVSPWRDRDPAEAPEGVAPCVRLKMPTEGETVIQDEVQGEVRVPNNELDDMILLRADGSPTYMLAVVVDDHDMGVTHVIRGDDHLTNCFRQAQLFEALGWAPPAYGHIPLIHGPDGAKLSKRHGAQSVTDFAEMGYLPEAVNCYLLRLGWSHGDQEIFTWEEAVTLFDTDGINKAPSRLDFEKLGHVNQHFMKQRPTAEMVELAAPFVEAKCGIELDEPKRRLLETAMPELASRAKTLVELADQGAFLFQPRPLAPSDKAQKLLDKADAQIIADIRDTLSELTDFSAGSIETALRGLSESKGIGMKKIAQPTRAALTGSHASPGIGEVAAWLGQAEAVARLDDAHQNRLKADQNQNAPKEATGGGKPDEFKAAAPGM